MRYTVIGTMQVRVIVDVSATDPDEAVGIALEKWSLEDVDPIGEPQFDTVMRDEDAE